MIKLPVKTDGHAAGADGQGLFLVDADDVFIGVIQEEFAEELVNILNSHAGCRSRALRFEREVMQAFQSLNQ